MSEGLDVAAQPVFARKQQKIIPRRRFVAMH